MCFRGKITAKPCTWEPHLLDWKTHGSEYYECSRYKENPSIAQEANHLKARRALEKYLHYFERFENHNKSLKMEEELRAKIKKKIDEKVNRHEGTWIDWQYLHDAATLLTKCRYTLQYTYPFAYYMENGPRKELVGSPLSRTAYIARNFSSSTSRHSSRRRSRSCRGRWNVPRRRIAATSRIRCTWRSASDARSFRTSSTDCSARCWHFAFPVMLNPPVELVVIF